MKELGRKVADVLLGDPGGPEVGIDVAREDVLGLDGTKCFRVPREVRPGTLGLGELRPDVPREVGVCRLPGFALGVLED